MRWYGKVGYAEQVEVDPVNAPSVYENVITEKFYTGDIMRNNRRWNNNGSINGEVTISSQISILSDPYIIDNFHKIRYAEFMGALWCVTDVEPQYPRLVLTLGGVYNGEQANPGSDAQSTD